MANEMIERVARALFDVEWKDRGDEREFADSKDYWLRSARAALGAMQKPDTKTINAGKEAFIFPSEGDRKSVSVRGSVSAVWQAMLSAALEQPQSVDEKEGI